MARILALIPALLLALPATASAATTCSFDSTMGWLEVDLPASNDKAILSVASPNIVVDNGEQALDCGGPQVGTTRNIVVASEPEATDTRVEILGASSFAPGIDDELGGDKEIEIFVHLSNSPGSRLTVSDHVPGGVTLRIGDVGINPNASDSEVMPDADIFPSVPEGRLLVTGGGGPDVLGAQGGAGTGPPLPWPVTILAGDGDDRLAGGAGPDLLVGGAGDDALDVRDGGPDSADCGPGTDTIASDAAGIDTLSECELVQHPMPPSGGEPGRDTLPPAFLGRVRVRRQTLRFALSEAGTVKVVIRRGKRRVRSFEAPAVAGPNRTRLGRLRPGRYRATLLATDAAGNRSEPRRTTFRVVRRGERVRSRRGPGRAGR